jgi:hypothetical protein
VFSGKEDGVVLYFKKRKMDKVVTAKQLNKRRLKDGL